MAFHLTPYLRTGEPFSETSYAYGEATLWETQSTKDCLSSATLGNQHKVTSSWKRISHFMQRLLQMLSINANTMFVLHLNANSICFAQSMPPLWSLCWAAQVCSSCFLELEADFQRASVTKGRAGKRAGSQRVWQGSCGFCGGFFAFRQERNKSKSEFQNLLLEQLGFVCGIFFFNGSD